LDLCSSRDGLQWYVGVEEIDCATLRGENSFVHRGVFLAFLGPEPHAKELVCIVEAASECGSQLTIDDVHSLDFLRDCIVLRTGARVIVAERLDDKAAFPLACDVDLSKHLAAEGGDHDLVCG